MSAPSREDRVLVRARFLEARGELVTLAIGIIEVQVHRDAVLTTEGKPFDWNPPCTSMLLIEGERFYLRCESTDHPKRKHWAHCSPSDVEWDDDDPNAVRIES